MWEAIDFSKYYTMKQLFTPPGFFNTDTKNMKIAEYIRETQAEMSHVNWPTRAETVRFTVLVIAVSVATAALLGLSDFVFSRLLTLLF
jgi:preprotein translocase SecE subunit